MVSGFEAREPANANVNASQNCTVCQLLISN